MRPPRFLLKLYGSFIALILLTLVAADLIGARWLETRAVEATQATLRGHAILLGEIVAQDGVESAAFQDSVKRLGRRLGTRLTVIRASGEVLADSEESPELMDNHGNRPEVRQALEQGHGEATRFSRTTGHDMRYYAEAVEDGPSRWVVRASIRSTLLEEQRRELRTRLLLGGVAAASGALLLGWFLARRVTRRLTRMTRAAAALASGESGLLQPPLGGDEIDDLGRALAEMSKRLEWRLGQLRQERNKLIAVLAGMAEGVVAVDRSEKVLHVNQTAARLLGVEPEHWLGQSLLQHTRIPALTDALQEVLEDGCTVSSEFRLPDAEPARIVRLQASPLRDAAGEVTGAVFLLQDVTELRRLETVRRDFVANVSHEIKTPLTALRGLVETIDQDPDMEPGVRRRFLGKVRDQVHRLTTLVQDLLALSRAESGSLAEPQPLDLRLSVEACVETWSRETEKRRLSLRAALPQDPVVVAGDPESLRQIIDNLLSNAVRYTPEGGRVEVDLRAEAGQALLGVQDSGIGIEARFLDRVFERFYRVDKARSRELGGTGLGLAIVKHLVEMLGGQVSVDSSPGRGSTFRVRLPLHANGSTSSRDPES